MIYNFKTEEDGQQWVVDTEVLNWARASSIVAAPSVLAAESNLARFVPTEEGRLIPLGGGRYVLEGRQPFVPGPNGQPVPQFALFIVLTILSADKDGTCVTFLQANVPVKDFQHQSIKNFAAQVMPPLQLTPQNLGKIPAVKSPVSATTEFQTTQKPPVELPPHVGNTLKVVESTPEEKPSVTLD